MDSQPPPNSKPIVKQVKDSISAMKTWACFIAVLLALILLNPWTLGLFSSIFTKIGLPSLQTNSIPAPNVLGLVFGAAILFFILRLIVG